MNGPNRSPLARTLSFILAALWYLCLAWNAVMLLFLAALLGGFEIPANVKVMVPLPVSVSYEKEEAKAQTTVAYSERSDVIAGHTDVIVSLKEVKDRIILCVAVQILFLAMLLIVRELRAILNAVKSGRPFSRENPRRLRRIGWLVLALGPLEWIWSQWMAARFYHKLVLPGAEFNLPHVIHLDSVLLGLLILLIAQIFELGVRLQEEQDLTV